MEQPGCGVRLGFLLLMQQEGWNEGILACIIEPHNFGIAFHFWKYSN
jgi:hypothetical protein